MTLKLLKALKTLKQTSLLLIPLLLTPLSLTNKLRQLPLPLKLFKSGSAITFNNLNNPKFNKY
jgi:hypothetical protein